MTHSQGSTRAFLEMIATGALCALLILPGSACARPVDGDRAVDDAAARRELLVRLNGYTAAARAVDAESSAAYFTDGGTLFEPGIPPIVSRDSIRAFVKSFPGVVVDSAMATADTIEVFGTAACGGRTSSDCDSPVSRRARSAVAS